MAAQLTSPPAREGSVDSPPVNRHRSCVAGLLGCLLFLTGGTSPTAAQSTQASTTFAACSAAGAVDGNRFSGASTNVWSGAPGQTNWWWQVRFDSPRTLGGILQIIGDHDFVLRNAPRGYVWQASRDGRRWFDLKETATRNERRTFRLHRLKQNRRVQFLRLRIDSVTGERPVLREVEFLTDRRERLRFPDWIIAVNTTHERSLPNHGQEFIPLARGCEGWSQLQAQQVWLASFDPEFAAIEPRPLAAFLSGNFKDWCEVEREPWRGTQEILRRKQLPLWASCGGAQGLAILAETGVDRPWDCPHCRDPKRPRLPIYRHIGHTAARPCGDYSGCVFERGPRLIASMTLDPVFRGLGVNFEVMESHCGQIEWPPKEWAVIATGAEGSLTRVQCLRLKNHPIYAAQFHIEMTGTPETSREIMANFLALARAWHP